MATMTRSGPSFHDAVLAFTLALLSVLVLYCVNRTVDLENRIVKLEQQAEKGARP